MTEITAVPFERLLPTGEQEWWRERREQGEAIAEALVGWFDELATREHELAEHLDGLGLTEAGTGWARGVAGVDSAFDPVYRAVIAVVIRWPGNPLIDRLPSGD